MAEKIDLGLWSLVFGLWMGRWDEEELDRSARPIKVTAKYTTKDLRPKTQDVFSKD